MIEVYPLLLCNQMSEHVDLYTGFNTLQIPRKGKSLNINSLVIYTCIYFSLYGMLFLFPKSLRVFPACVLCDRCT